MLNWIKSFFIEEETNSLCPNSLAPMPKNKFHNYAIVQCEHDDCEEPNKTIWDIFDFNKYNKTCRKNIFYTFYGGFDEKIKKNECQKLK